MDYQHKVIQAYEAIENAKIELFTALTKVALAVEFKEMEEILATEDSFSFRESDFDNAEDPNIEILLNLVRQMTITQEEMTAWNGKKYLTSQKKQ